MRPRLPFLAVAIKHVHERIALHSLGYPQDYLDDSGEPYPPVAICTTALNSTDAATAAPGRHQHGGEAVRGGTPRHGTGTITGEGERGRYTVMIRVIGSSTRDTGDIEFHALLSATKPPVSLFSRCSKYLDNCVLRSRR